MRKQKVDSLPHPLLSTDLGLKLKIFLTVQNIPLVSLEQIGQPVRRVERGRTDRQSHRYHYVLKKSKVRNKSLNSVFKSNISDG